MSEEAVVALPCMSHREEKVAMVGVGHWLSDCWELHIPNCNGNCRSNVNYIEKE